MTKNKQKRTLIIFSILIFLLVAAVVLLIIFTKPMPVSLLQEYGMKFIWDEGATMNECAECHDSVDFHTCETCHDDHGAVELVNIPFSKIVQLTGDVPDPSFVRINQIIPNQDEFRTHITVFQFLEMHGIEAFETITFTTNDGGLTTIEYQYLDETAMLVPYVDGVRFVTESVHVSTWLKGIERIIIVGKETPLSIDGKQTSIGRLLLGNTTRLTVESADVMLASEDGKTSHAYVANWIDGALLLPLLENQAPDYIIITDGSGIRTTLAGEEIQGAVIALVRGEVTLVLPQRGRSMWLANIVSIESKDSND
jgi:hypothetical protein